MRVQRLLLSKVVGIQPKLMAGYQYAFHYFRQHRQLAFGIKHV